MLKWSAFIAALAIAGVAFRYTVYPPSFSCCCTRLRVDSVGPVAGEDKYALLANDTLIMVGADSIRVKGKTIAIPAVGLRLSRK